MQHDDAEIGEAEEQHPRRPARDSGDDGRQKKRERNPQTNSSAAGRNRGPVALLRPRRSAKFLVGIGITWP